MGVSVARCEMRVELGICGLPANAMKTKRQVNLTSAND